MTWTYYLLGFLVLGILAITVWYWKKGYQKEAKIAAGAGLATLIGGIGLIVIQLGGCGFPICSGDVAVSGYDSSNMGDSYDELLLAFWNEENTTRKVGPYTIIPWFNQGDNRCDTSYLASGSACNIGTVSITSGNYCMVTDELSQGMYVFAMGDNQSIFDGMYNTTRAIATGTYGQIPGWRIVVNESGQSFEPCRSGVNGNCDTASDGTARIIIALYSASKNSRFSDTTRKQLYADFAKNLSREMRQYEYETSCHNINVEGNTQELCEWSAGGSDVVANGNLGSTDFAYSGYLCDNAQAQLADCIQTGNETACQFANYTWLTYYAAAYPNTTSIATDGFRATPGLAFKFDTSGTYAYAQCTRDCGPVCWDTVDAPRAACWGMTWYYATIANKTQYFQGLGDYVSAWAHEHALASSSSWPYRYYPNGTACASSESGYKAQGFQAQLLMYNATVAGGQDAFNASLRSALDHYDTATDTWDFQGCFGIYGQAFSMRALGAGLGLDNDVWTNGTNFTGGGSSNITISGPTLNSTSGDQNATIQINSTVSTTNGDIDTVLFEIQHPNGTKINYTATRHTYLQQINGSDGNTTIYSCDYSSTSCGFDLAPSGGILNTTSSTSIDLGLSAYTWTNWTSDVYMPVGGQGCKVDLPTGDHRWIIDPASEWKVEPDYDVSKTSFPTATWTSVSIITNHTANTSYICFSGGCSSTKTGFDVNSATDTMQLVTTYAGGDCAFDNMVIKVAPSDNPSTPSYNSTVNTTTWYINFSETANGGTYTVTNIWANSTTGEENSTIESTTFNISGARVNVGPNVTLLTPANATNTTALVPVNVSFTFNVTDDNTTSLSCGLWINTTGTFQENKTFTGTNNSGGSTSLNLYAGEYLWNIQCTDSDAVSAFASSNYTLFINNITVTNTSVTRCSGILSWVFQPNVSNGVISLPTFKYTEYNVSPENQTSCGYTYTINTTGQADGLNVTFYTNLTATDLYFRANGEVFGYGKNATIPVANDTIAYVNISLTYNQTSLNRVSVPMTINYTQVTA